ncbi:MAG: hypothetical protein HFH59_13695 [Lachnospiraceae bacterium]|nr:hypothetical protein [Lachnospiraceae bacterium]
MLKRYLKLAAADLCIAASAVVLYSPGLVNLRLSDYSIFRAGMSIIAAVILITLFFVINIRLLKEPEQKPIMLEDVPDLERAKDILQDYCKGRYFGSLAKTASEQLDRILKCRQRLSVILEQKFTRGTMSWDKFNSTVSAAESSAIKNVVAMANRMCVFDEKEYARLQNYREDDIPDDIQEEQLRLYQKNLEAIRWTIALNEKILLKLDALAMELSSSASRSDADWNHELVSEIERLTEETRYYD